MLEAAVAAGRRRRRRRGAARRRAADPRRAAADRPLRASTSASSSPPRTTRTATTASSSSAATASSSPTRPRRRSRSALDEPVASHGPHRLASAASTARSRTTCAALHERFAGLDLQRPHASLLDCANGATYRAAPEIFRRLGAEVDVLAAAPDGRNINDGCGSTHVERLADTMTEGGHDVGLRVRRRRRPHAGVDRAGAVVDGDELIALAALHLRAGRPAARPRRGRDGDDQLRLPHRDARRGGRGRDHAGRRPLRARGAARARLGARRRAVRPHHRHGLRALRRRHRRGAAHARGARRRRPRRPPRRWRSCRRSSSTCAWPTARRSAAATAAAREAIEREAAALEGRGRVLVRPSGTEPLVRVMVEAPTAEEADATCERLVAAVDNWTNGGEGSPTRV